MSDRQATQGEADSLSPNQDTWTALLSIGEGAARQVSFANKRGSISVDVRVREDSDLEISLPYFIPRQCSVKVQILAQSTSVESLVVRGAVRRIQMTSPEPAYRLIARLEAEDSERLVRWVDDVSGAEASSLPTVGN